MIATLTDLWPHQQRGHDDTLAAIARGERHICVTSPTGGGKSFMMARLAQHYLEGGGKVVLYTNRRLLIEQTSAKLLDAGMYHGIRSAGHEDEREHPFQISSIQTEHQRVTKKGTWHLHEADLVLVDECHLQTGDMVTKLLAAHDEQGAVRVGYTATPLGLAGVYDHLVIAGQPSELRKCGALVPAVHYGPDEPDFREFKKLQAKLNAGENLSESELAKLNPRTPALFGRVWKWFNEINPNCRPTILFGPDVEGSIWFAEQFCKKGVEAVHIDGEHIWQGGRLYRTSQEQREAIREGAKEGTIKVICNRFVLREGVDMPFVSHLILPVIGSLQSYLQAGGRALRSCPGKEFATIQDHGGSWHRHGSLNADRHWSLELTGAIASGLRHDRMRNKKESEPFRCPKCGRIWTSGNSCQPAHGGCGYVLESGKRSRPVVSTDGVMKEMTGDIYRPRRISQKPNGPALWERMYWRSRTEKGARTFRAAFAMFAMENYWSYPSPSWPLMPLHEIDAFRLVSEVPMDRLVPKESHQ